MGTIQLCVICANWRPFPVKIELEVEVCTLLRKENKEEKRVTWMEIARLLT